MDAKSATQMKQWVECWKQAGIELERIRQEELLLVSTTQALLALADAYESCRLPPSFFSTTLFWIGGATSLVQKI